MDYTLDFFSDNSCIALFPLFDSATPLGGAWNVVNVNTTFGHKIENNYFAKFSKNSSIKSDSYGIKIPNNNIKTVSLFFSLLSSPASSGYMLWSSGKLQNGVVRTGIRINTALELVDTQMSDLVFTDRPKFELNRVYHICISGKKIYLDGNLIVNAGGNGMGYSADTYGFYLGVNGAYDYGYLYSGTYGSALNGYERSVRLFNRELTDNEVLDLYKNKKIKKIINKKINNMQTVALLSNNNIIKAGFNSHVLNKGAKI